MVLCTDEVTEAESGDTVVPKDRFTSRDANE